MQKSKLRRQMFCEVLAIDRPGLNIFHNFPLKRRLRTLNKAIQSSVSVIKASDYLSIRDRTSKSDIHINFVESIYFTIHYDRMYNSVTHSNECRILLAK